MKLLLTNGEALLYVRIPPSMAGERRKVWVALMLPSGEQLIGISVCAQGDQFSRFTGKKLALERLLYSTANGWHGEWVPTCHPDPHQRRFVPLPLVGRADRGRLWAAVLGPKYAVARWAVTAPQESLLATGHGWF